MYICLLLERYYFAVFVSATLPLLLFALIFSRFLWGYDDDDDGTHQWFPQIDAICHLLCAPFCVICRKFSDCVTQTEV